MSVKMKMYFFPTHIHCPSEFCSRAYGPRLRVFWPREQSSKFLKAMNILTATYFFIFYSFI